MNGYISSVFQKALAWWVVTAGRWALVVVFCAGLGAVGALQYSAAHLGINTDTGEMFSPELPFRKAWQRFKQAFPKQIDTFVVVIDGDSPQQARQAAGALAERLRQRPDLYDTVESPGVGDFYDKNGLFYLDIPKLEDLADRLSRVQPFLATLSEDPSLRGLFDVTGRALAEESEHPEVDISPLLDNIDRTLAASLEGSHYSLPWQELMTGTKAELNDRRFYLIVRPHMDFNQLFPAADALATVRELGRQLAIDRDHGLRLRITGELALEYEELQSVSQGAAVAAILSLAVGLLMLWFAFRSLRLVTATLLTLLTGLIFTMTFATVAVGTLNMISVAFAVLYIGLSLDFSIHFGLRYRELLNRDISISRALELSVRQTGPSLLLCTLTTAVGFYAFMPTDYQGVSELGLIAGTGMFISLALTLTLFPALLSLWPLRLKPGNAHSHPHGVPRPLLALSNGMPKRAGWLFATVVLAAVASLPYVQFDYNPLNLRSPTSESVATFVDLLETSEPPPWYMTVLVDKTSDVQPLQRALEARESVDKIVSLTSFVPGQQPEKQDYIDEINLILGPELGAPRHSSGLSQHQRLAALQQFRQSLAIYLQTEAPRQRQRGAALLEKLDRLLNEITALPAAAAGQRTARLEQALVGTLPGNLALLEKSLAGESFGLADLPPQLQAQWQSPTGLQRIAVFPKQNIGDNQALRTFVDDVRAVAANATGAPINYLESGDAVIKAFQIAIGGAVAVITLLLLLILRRLLDVVYVLIPLLIGGILTVAFTVVWQMPFNFANIIALPLLLGIGVDNGIHLVHRHRAAPLPGHDLMATSTARGILFSALTTIVSFLSLAFSAHPGTASMGVLLSVGMILTLLTTLLVLPTLLERDLKRRQLKEAA